MGKNMKRHLFCAARFKDDGLSQRDPSRRRHTAPNRVFDIFSSALSGESSCQQSSQCVCPSPFIRFNKNAPFFFPSFMAEFQTAVDLFHCHL